MSSWSDLERSFSDFFRARLSTECKWEVSLHIADLHVTVCKQCALIYLFLLTLQGQKQADMYSTVEPCSQTYKTVVLSSCISWTSTYCYSQLYFFNLVLVTQAGNDGMIAFYAVGYFRKFLASFEPYHFIPSTGVSRMSSIHFYNLNISVFSVTSKTIRYSLTTRNFYIKHVLLKTN